MLTIIDLSHSSVLAQDTTSTLDNMPMIPAPETSSGDEDGSSSSEDSEESSFEDSDESDAQKDISSSEEEEADETEDDYAMTSPFREQIRERVFGAFNVSGVVFP